jgi:cell division protein FtsA
VGLRTPLQTAEKLKLEHGVALPSLAAAGAMVEIAQIAGKESRKVPVQELSLIIEPRLTEIFYLAAQELAKIGYRGPLPAGVVLTGGVSLLRGATELAEQIFNSPVRIAQPSYVGVKSPIYSTGVGIIHYVQRNHLTSSRERRRKGPALPGFISRIRSWFMEAFD